METVEEEVEVTEDVDVDHCTSVVVVVGKCTSSKFNNTWIRCRKFPLCARVYTDLSSLLKHEQTEHGGELVKSTQIKKFNILTLFNELRVCLKRCDTTNVSVSSDDNLSQMKGGKFLRKRPRSSAVLKALADDFELDLDGSTINFAYFSDYEDYNEDSNSKRSKKGHPPKSKSSKPLTNFCPVCDRGFGRKEHLKNHILTHNSIKPHVCEICKRGYHSMKYLKHHLLNSHNPTGEKPYNCTICEKAFVTNRARLGHERKAHLSKKNRNPEDKKYTCSFCGKKFLTKTYLMKHENFVHRKMSRGERIHCEYCDKGFLKESSLKNHNCILLTSKYKYDDQGNIVKVSSEPDNPATATTTSSATTPAPQLPNATVVKIEPNGSLSSIDEDSSNKGLSHRKTKTPSSSQKFSKVAVAVIKIGQDGSISTIAENIPVQGASVSQSKTKTGSSVSNELKKGSIVKIDQDGSMTTITEDFPIDIKDEVVMARSSAAAEAQNEESESDEGAADGGEYILPDKPNKPVEKSSDLTSNLNKKTTDSSSSIDITYKYLVPKKGKKCLHCDKEFSTRSGLYNHVERINNQISGEKKHKCEKCDKTFNCKDNLKSHKRIHSTAKPFKCIECDATFRTSHGCRFHIMRHRGSKPFKCSTCSLKFLTRQQKKTHELVHSKIRKYNCSGCEKTFRLKHQLDQHERVHTGEKPLRCKFCNRGFARYNQRSVHQRRHLKHMKEQEEQQKLQITKTEK